MVKQAEKSNKKTTKEAQKTAPEVQEAPPKEDTGTPPEAPESPPEANEASPETGTDETPETPPEAEEPPKRYVFPRQGDIKCPACGLYETVATSTQGPIQRRRCTRAIPRCEHTFKVTGQEVKSTDCKQES